jgi:hypothetical protein|tara:strand:+ start:3789 stop:4223 length:435 start_codon:yes stop_codon:yes gene_type:complete
MAKYKQKSMTKKSSGVKSKSYAKVYKKKKKIGVGGKVGAYNYKGKKTPYERRMADRKILKKKGIRPKKSLGSPNRSAGERERASGSRFVEKVRKAEKTNPELWKKVQEEVNAPNYKTNSSAKPKHRATITYLKQGGGYKIKKKK